MNTILIVDNEPLDLSILQQMLEDADYRIVTASNGRGVLMATNTLDLEYIQPGDLVRIRIPIDGQ